MWLYRRSSFRRHPKRYRRFRLMPDRPCWCRHRLMTCLRYLQRSWCLPCSARPPSLFRPLTWRRSRCHRSSGRRSWCSLMRRRMSQSMYRRRFRLRIHQRFGRLSLRRRSWSCRRQQEHRAIRVRTYERRESSVRSRAECDSTLWGRQRDFSSRSGGEGPQSVSDNDARRSPKSRLSRAMRNDVAAFECDHNERPEIDRNPRVVVISSRARHPRLISRERAPWCWGPPWA
jgi:hypothetical protein